MSPDGRSRGRGGAGVPRPPPPAPHRVRVSKPPRGVPRPVTLSKTTVHPNEVGLPSPPVGGWSGRSSTGTSVTRAGEHLECAARVADAAGAPRRRPGLARTVDPPGLVAAAVAAVLTAAAPAVATAAPAVHRPPRGGRRRAGPGPVRRQPARRPVVGRGEGAGGGGAGTGGGAGSTAGGAAGAGRAARAGPWETRGRPTKLVVIRTTTLDQIDGGRLTRRIPRFGAVITLPQLERYLPRPGCRSATGRPGSAPPSSSPRAPPSTSAGR